MSENGNDAPAASGSGSGDVVYTTVDSLRPLMEGVNLVCKCIDVKVVVNRRRPDGSFNKIAEAKVRDGAALGRAGAPLGGRGTRGGGRGAGIPSAGSRGAPPPFEGRPARAEVRRTSRRDR